MRRNPKAEYCLDFERLNWTANNTTDRPETAVFERPENDLKRSAGDCPLRRVYCGAMQHCDTLIAPRWCVPVEPARRGPRRARRGHQRWPNCRPSCRCRGRTRSTSPACYRRAPGHLLIPGLVNAHTHAAMTLFRGCRRSAARSAGCTKRIWPVEKRWVSAEMVRDGTELAIAEMLRAGIPASVTSTSSPRSSPKRPSTCTCAPWSARR